jgi:hypothetical protein
MSISDITTINITLDTKVPTRAGFGTPILMTYHTATPNLVEEVTSADEVLDLGFTEAHPAYTTALALFSQEVSPPKMLIGKRQTYTEILHLTPVNLTVGYVYEFTIVDALGAEKDISHTVVTGTVDAIVDALVTAITTAAPNSVTPTADAGTATKMLLTGAAGKYFSLKNLPNPTDMLVYDATVAGTTVADLNAVLGSIYEPQFYAILWDRVSEAEAAAAAAVVEAIDKIMLFDTSDSEAVDGGDTDDIGSTLRALAYKNSAGFYLSNATGAHQMARLAGRRLPDDPGSENWAHVNLSGMAADELLSGQKTALTNKNLTHYVDDAGSGRTHWGNVADGNFIDVIRLKHWTKARMAENVVGKLQAAKKVPYTDAGIAIIVAAVRAVWAAGVRAGGYDGSREPLITFPLAAEVDAAQKAERNLPDIRWQFYLAGAINKVQPITGTISL